MVIVTQTCNSCAVVIYTSLQSITYQFVIWHNQPMVTHTLEFSLYQRRGNITTQEICGLGKEFIIDPIKYSSWTSLINKSFKNGIDTVSPSLTWEKGWCHITPQLLDWTNKNRIGEVAECYNATRGVFSNGILEYVRPKVNPERHKFDFTKNLSWYW